MKITSITYRTNANLGGYRTKHLEATAQLAPGEKPEAALIRLAAWVHKQLGIPVEVERTRAPLRNLGDEGGPRATARGSRAGSQRLSDGSYRDAWDDQP